MRRVFALDFVRAAAIVCVLLAHAWYARFPEGAVDGSPAAHAMLVTFLLFQAGTAVFVLISGALIIPKERREGFPFLWRRAFSFLLLAAFWSVVTNACWYAASGWSASSSLWYSLRYHSLLFGGWGSRAGYLWFLLMMWGLYLAAPYLARLAYAAPPRDILIFAGLSCLLSPLPLTLDAGGTARSFLDADVLVTFGGYEVFGVFASWFLLGHLFWSEDARGRIARVTRHGGLWLFLLLALVIGAGGALEFARTGAQAIYAPVHLFASSLALFFAAPLFFLLLLFVAPWAERQWFAVWISRLARHSFGIYLSHFAILHLLLAFLAAHGLGPDGRSMVPVALAFVVTLAASWGLTVVLSRLPLLRRLVT